MQRFFHLILMLVFLFSISSNAEVLPLVQLKPSPTSTPKSEVLRKYSVTDPSIEFVGIAYPALLKIKGHSQKLEGEIQSEKNQVKVFLTLDLKTLTTDNEQRDSHMKNKYLEVEKYPKTELKINQLTLSEDLEKLSKSQKDLPFQGELNLHGQSKSVTGTYDLEVKDKQISIVAKFTISIADFKIETPSFAGLKVTDKVNVESRFKLQKLE